MKHTSPFRRLSIRRKKSLEPSRPDVIEIPTEPPRAGSDRTARDALVDSAGRRRFSKKRLFLAFSIAVVSDITATALIWLPPLVWAIDLLTAILLFAVLGWSWFLLPGLLLEAIPGLEVLPLWVLVVGAIAIFGSPRPRLR